MRDYASKKMAIKTLFILRRRRFEEALNKMLWRVKYQDLKFLHQKINGGSKVRVSLLRLFVYNLFCISQLTFAT